MDATREDRAERGGGGGGGRDRRERRSGRAAALRGGSEGLSEKLRGASRNNDLFSNFSLLHVEINWNSCGKILERVYCS